MFIDDLLLAQAHHGLEEIVEDPRLVVELVGGQDVSHRVESTVAEEGANEGAGLLLDAGIVLLMAAIRAGQGDTGHELSSETQQVVEEDTVVVRVDALHREGHTAQDAAKGTHHHQLTAS